MNSAPCFGGANLRDDRGSDAAFITYLKNEGFLLNEVEGDGNCIFRTIAHQMVGDKDKHERYLRLACQYIRINHRKFKDFLLTTYEGCIEQYLAKMEKNGTWEVIWS